MIDSWIPGDTWPVDVLPFGVVRHGRAPRPTTAIGDHVLDLAGAARDGLLDGALPDPEVLEHPNLDRFLAAGPDAWRGVRSRLTELATDPGARRRVEQLLSPLASAPTVLPWTVADYVDFYSSLDHATNVGRIFRPDDDPLPAAWRHLPIGYHGRAGTVVVSGTDVVRPCGLRRIDDAVVFAPTDRLDVEVEVGFVVGRGSELGERIPTTAFADHVFGVVLVNDWSARDIQAFEYRPLGPFLGKSFATSVSSWIVPLDALESARTAPPAQDPTPSQHLLPAGDGMVLELELEVAGSVVSRPPFATTYWTPAQQLAHLTSNGAAIRTGDLYASGTVSGPEPGQRGCLLELTWGGTDPIELDGGRSRTWLEDGDLVTIRGTAPRADGSRMPLGAVTGRVAPART